MKEGARIFKALADPTRLRMVNLLLKSPLCVCELEELLELPQPLLSRHVAYLRNCGLVEGERERMRVVYSLRRGNPYLQALAAPLAELLATNAEGRADLRKLDKLAAVNPA